MGIRHKPTIYFSISFQGRVKEANQHYCFGVTLESMSSCFSPWTQLLLVRLGGGAFEVMSKEKTRNPINLKRFEKCVAFNPYTCCVLMEWGCLLRLRKLLFQVTVLGTLDFMEKENPCQSLQTTFSPYSLCKYPGAAFSLRCEVMLIFTSLDVLSHPKALSDLQNTVLSEGGKGWNSAQSQAHNRYSINTLELWRKWKTQKENLQSPLQWIARDVSLFHTDVFCFNAH